MNAQAVELRANSEPVVTPCVHRFQIPSCPSITFGNATKIPLVVVIDENHACSLADNLRTG